ncbi:MAG: DNA repair protein RadA [Acidimicrobiales bacterium]
MAQPKTVYACTGCGAQAPKWVGRCGSCGEWNTLVEELVQSRSSAVYTPALGADTPTPMPDIDVAEWAPYPTGFDEIDRVLGGGLVPGSVTLLGGEPGVGKSTLLLQLTAQRCRSGSRCLYVTAEESKQQVRLRAERLGLLQPDLWLVSSTALPEIIHHIDSVKPELLIIDSIQTIFDPELSSAPGSVGQVRHCAHRLVVEAKTRALATVLVGHVTKDGSLAGPRVLEHVVDTVLEFEGDRHQELRLLRASKHRFGSTNELGLFEMGDSGLRGVSDPSELFLADRATGAPGSAVVATSDGHRPLLVEIQALVVNSPFPSPRRSGQGIDSGRLEVILAVLGKHAGLDFSKHDVYTLAIGGAKVIEPGADLGVAMALASAHLNVAVPEDVIVCGELGLAGELRRVAHIDRRLAEAHRHGFKRALVPPGTATDSIDGLRVKAVSDIGQAIRTVGLSEGRQ